MRRIALVTTAVVWKVLFLVLIARADVAADAVPSTKPDASIDLTTSAGTAAVRGTWRYADVRIVDATFRKAGADGQPSGAATQTYEIEPHAGGLELDDSRWEAVAAEDLDTRRGNGRLSFGWYRIRITVPAKAGTLDTTGTTIVFETSVDDYAEVWVDGELPRLLGQSGGSVTAGWNAPNRLVIARNAKPGQTIQLAVFGMNGPISNPVTNYVWMRSARLDFYREKTAPHAISPREVNVEVIRLDPGIDAIVPANPKIYKLAEGFEFTEGPVWSPDGYLLFSDPNANRIYKYTPDTKVEVWKEKSGYDGKDVAEYRQPGSNGLALDATGRLTINEHGRRRVVRLERDGTTTVVADAYDGKRLNSPNDLIYGADGSLYFTDPPFGLPRFHQDPRKELVFSGVYRVRSAAAGAPLPLELIDDSLSGPNGIALSPDQRTLYVGNWDEQRKVVMRYPIAPDGTVGKGSVFFDMTKAPGEEAIDGVEVDELGNLYVSGPGGVWILSADGKHLGTLVAPKLPANFAWGDEDGRTLYLTARSGLYRMRLSVRGARVGSSS
jgi:gluconolactonase